MLLYAGNDLSGPGHPFIPMIQVGIGQFKEDVDFEVMHTGEEVGPRILATITDTLSGSYIPVRSRMENIDFQVTRGVYGISL